MKATLIIVLSFLASVSKSQTSFVLTRQTNSTVITANAVIDLVTTANNPLTVIVHIQNTSTITNSYSVKRYDSYLYKNTVDSALASFYFGGQDYSPSNTTALMPLVLSPNQSSATMGDYVSLGCILTEASTVGYSLVKYTLFNTAQTSDTIQFSLRYNFQLLGVGIKKEDLKFSNFQILPNPTKGLANISLLSESPSEAQLSIYSALGTKVLEQSVQLTAGQNTLPLNLFNFVAGAYFVQIRDGKGLCTRKIIVE